MRRHQRPRVASFALAALVACAATAGCTPSGTKAGPDRPATVLHLATPEARGAPYTDDVDYFVDRVADLTGGSVRVEADFEVVPWTMSSEQTITGMVQDGKTDLALVPPRVFDTLGIEGFEALQTPMLIDTPELAGAVATSDVAAAMLAGLQEHGVVGLGLVYEGLRRPMALNGAITRARDFEGLLIRVPVSNVSDLVFAALGAVPDHGSDHRVATTGQPYPLVETELALAETDFPAGSTVTQNLVVFPKYDALVANAASFGRLTGEQQDAVRRAVVDTVKASVQTTADEQDLAATYCETAGDLVAAPETEIAAAHQMLRPVVDELRQDAATASAIDAIEALKAGTRAPRVTAPPACSPPSGDALRLPSAPAAPTP